MYRLPHSCSKLGNNNNDDGEKEKRAMVNANATVSRRHRWFRVQPLALGSGVLHAMADRENLACSGSRWRAGRAGERARVGHYLGEDANLGDHEGRIAGWERAQILLQRRLECGAQHTCSTTLEKAALPFQYPGWKLTPYHMQELARGLPASRLALAPLLKHRFGPLLQAGEPHLKRRGRPTKTVRSICATYSIRNPWTSTASLKGFALSVPGVFTAPCLRASRRLGMVVDSGWRVHTRVLPSSRRQRCSGPDGQILGDEACWPLRA